MLREGVARAQAVLQEGKVDAGAGGRARRGREETEAKRLSGLDLGEGSRFAALAETCLELREGVRKSERERESCWTTCGRAG